MLPIAHFKMFSNRSTESSIVLFQPSHDCVLSLLMSNIFQSQKYESPTIVSLHIGDPYHREIDIHCPQMPWSG